MTYRDPKTGRWAKQDTKTLVFVYGTLKRPYGNNHILRSHSASFMGEAVTVDPWLMYSSGIPFVVPVRSEEDEAASAPIKGELWEVGTKCLQRLDQLEGYIEGWAHNMYDRVDVVVQLPSGDKVGAKMYVAGKRSMTYMRRDHKPYSHTEDGALCWYPQNYKVMGRADERAEQSDT